MNFTDLCLKILQILALGLPSIVTIIVVLNRNSFKTQLINIKQNIQSYERNNIIRTNQILARVEKHQQIIKSLLHHRDISDRIHDITKYAIEYMYDRRLSKILENTTQQFIDFVYPISQCGFHSISRQQLLAKIQVNRDASLHYIKTILSHDQYELWASMADPIVAGYINSLFEIYNDPVNDKTNRFIIKSEDYLQTLTRQFIKFASIIKYNKVGDGV